MEEQASRLYCDIMEDVCKRVLEEGAPLGIDPEMVHLLHMEWVKSLERLQSEDARDRMVSVLPAEMGDKRGCAVDDESVEGFGESTDDAEIDRLDESIKSYMMCLFVKVDKPKNKWKCSFKQGFVNIDNDDIPFSTATGELEW